MHLSAKAHIDARGRAVGVVSRVWAMPRYLRGVRFDAELVLLKFQRRQQNCAFLHIYGLPAVKNMVWHRL